MYIWFWNLRPSYILQRQRCRLLVTTHDTIVKHFYRGNYPGSLVVVAIAFHCSTQKLQTNLVLWTENPLITKWTLSNVVAVVAWRVRRNSISIQNNFRVLFTFAFDQQEYTHTLYYYDYNENNKEHSIGYSILSHHTIIFARILLFSVDIANK